MFTYDNTSTLKWHIITNYLIKNNLEFACYYNNQYKSTDTGTENNVAYSKIHTNVHDFNKKKLLNSGAKYKRLGPCLRVGTL